MHRHKPIIGPSGPPLAGKQCEGVTQRVTCMPNKIREHNRSTSGGSCSAVHKDHPATGKAAVDKVGSFMK